MQPKFLAPSLALAVLFIFTACLPLQGEAQERGEAQEEVVYSISDSASDTIVARTKSDSRTLWESKIPLCHSEKHARIRENVFTEVVQDGDSLRAKSRWGAEFRINPKTGSWNPAGAYCLKSERLQNLEPQKPGRAVEYKLEGLILRVRLDDLLQGNTAELAKLFRGKGAPAIRRFDGAKIDKSQHEIYESHFVEGSYRAISEELESQFQAYKELDESLNRNLLQGRVEVKDEKTGTLIPRLLVVEWSWQGCGGNCEAEGHFFATEDLERSFFHRQDRRSERFPRSDSR